MLKIVTLLTALCLVQTTIILWSVINRSQPTTPLEAMLAVDGMDELRGVKREIASMAEQLAAATRAWESRRVSTERPDPAGEDWSAALSAFERATSRLEEILHQAPEIGGWLASIGELARTYPDTDESALTALARELDGPTEDQAARRWFFRPATDVIVTFGRPTRYTAGYWWYEFMASDGSRASVGFQVVSGIVVGCMGDISD